MSAPSVTITGDMLSDLTHAWISECPECHGVLGLACFNAQDLVSAQAAAVFAKEWDPVVMIPLTDRPLPGRPGHQATCSRQGQAR